MTNLYQATEQFHLLFLDQLGRKIDKRLYALKGGCNLRFYFKSIRYSEDLDLDVRIIRQDTLQKNMENILLSPNLQKNLQARGIKIANITTPKQTATVQRFKIALQIAGHSSLLPTKIEFSRRGFSGDALFENIDLAITQQYQLLPILLSHYDKDAALAQKLNALAKRSITQARDIFDLYLLLTQGAKLLNGTNSKLRMQAVANLDIMKYEDFLSQVVAFLTGEYQEQYTSRATWQHITNRVQELLN